MSRISTWSRLLSSALLTMLFVLLVADAHAQSSPLFETRAVWFATVLKDGNWPESPLDNAAEQEADLRDRIRRASALGLNTFVFQAVSRGDAMYESERLPWSYNLGNAGEHPGYDPLAVAVDEAHKLGMELHAWVNVFRIGDTSTKDRYQGVTDPEHVAFAHPEWVKERDAGDLWIDPSSDEARAWLVANVMEIVDNYDVDALHWDFIRYPQLGFQDDLSSCQFDTGDCPDLDQWRRDNVTDFVEAAYAEIYAAKPWVKVGATPIGHYDNDYAWGHLSGFHDVYQASREWAPGFADYLAPQVYWGIGETGGSPHFEVLAEEWVDETEAPVFVGIAAYGPTQYADFPPSQLDDQIAITRDVGAAGHIFFRYDHFIDYVEHILPTYPNPALVARMTHRFEIQAPSVPQNLTIRQISESTVELSWDTSEGSPSDPLHAYAIFRAEGAPPDVNSAEHLFATVGATSFSEGFDNPPTADVYYRVAAVSKLGELSAGSDAVSTEAVDLAVEGAVPGTAFRLLSIYPNPTPSEATLTLEVGHPGQVTVRVFDQLGRLVVRAHDGFLSAGRHELPLDLSSTSAGTYLVEVRREGGRIVRQVVRL